MYLYNKGYALLIYYDALLNLRKRQQRYFGFIPTESYRLKNVPCSRTCVSLEPKEGEIVI